MGVDELEQIELQVDTSVRQIRSTMVSKMYTICQLPQIVEFLGTGEVVRIETTNGWCLPVDSFPSHVHCAITPAQLELSVYQTLGSKLTTTKQYQRCYAGMGVDELEQLELHISKANKIYNGIKDAHDMSNSSVVRIETTNGLYLPVDSLPSHVHCAITPPQLGISVYQTLGSKLTTTKQYQRCYAGMGVDELEQLELQVDTSVRQIRSTTVSKMHTICQIPQIVEFLGTGDIVRIETTNGWCLPIVEFLGTGEVVRIETTNWWCLPVDSLPSHVHCAITPAQLGLSVYQTLGSKLTTTKQYQRCYAGS
ncbi:hypothetical protein F2Q70_00004978 [Brassica cretica]|uniref:Uncharacterized protein n=1 Tax=Brassica cretica TaxID=69181 RepID=A0A8S9J4W8_BRACR|nr:hypothetical protein F2Q70_00004978 [Brassica cretica]